MQSVLAKMSTGGEKIRDEGRIGRIRQVALSYGAFASYGSVESKSTTTIKGRSDPAFSETIFLHTYTSTYY